MESKTLVNVGHYLPEELADEMIPGRGALLATASPSTSIRDIWIEVIQSNTTLAEGGPRLKVTPVSESGTALAIVHFSLPGRVQSLNRAEGDELDVSSDRFLLLYRRGDGQSSAAETTTYVLWRDIQYLEFSRRAK